MREAVPRRPAPVRRFLLGRSTAMLLLLTLAGCATGVSARPGPASGPFAGDPGMTWASWTAPLPRLREDAPRAVARLHWSVVHQEESRLTALLPDGREAEVEWVQVKGDGVVPAGRAGVRVSRFGDRKLEANFLHALRRTVRGKPMRKRGGTFELPPATGKELDP